VTTELEFHPLANLFPLMEGEEFDALVVDIKANGLFEPIILYEGKILDGRNRYRAMLALGHGKQMHEHPCGYFLKYDLKPADPIAYVISANIRRRHLTTDQRAAFGAELAEKLAEAARARQLAGTLASNEAKGKAAEQAAKEVGVSTSSVERATKRKKEDPEAHKQAKGGRCRRSRRRRRPRASATVWRT
jgi:ParB-like chromosome segregation protein Spo0J